MLATARIVATMSMMRTAQRRPAASRSCSCAAGDTGGADGSGGESVAMVILLRGRSSRNARSPGVPAPPPIGVMSRSPTRATVTPMDTVDQHNGALPETLALAGLGLLSAAGGATRGGMRVAAVVWRSPPMRPTRALARPAVRALATRGRVAEERWLGMRPVGLTERVMTVAAEHAVIERAAAELLRAGVLEHVA